MNARRIARALMGMEGATVRLVDRRVVDVVAGSSGAPLRVFQVMGPRGCAALIQVEVDAELWSVPITHEEVRA